MSQANNFSVLQGWYEKSGGAEKLAGASLLRWYRTVGYARHGGVSVDMREPPDLIGDDIEYLPGVRMMIDGRQMTDDEVAHTARILVQMCEDARDALRGGSTLAVLIEFDRRK